MPPRLEDVMLTDGLPEPLNHLHSALDITEGFSAGARACARFFSAFGDRFTAGELVAKLFEPCVEAKWLETVLFCLLDVGYPYVQVAQQALRLKCLRRLMMRQQCRASMTDMERQVLDRVLESMPSVRSVSGIMSLSYQAREFVGRILRQGPVHSRQRSVIVLLIRAEVDALKARIDEISDGVHVYDLDEMARVLPHIRTFDENARDALELAEAIESDYPIHTRQLTLESAMDPSSFGRWLESVGSTASTAHVCALVTAQRTKLVPTRSLVSLTTMARWIGCAYGESENMANWIARAVDSYSDGVFRVDAGKAIEEIRTMAVNSGARVEGTVVSGNFSDRLFSQWTGPDRLTRPFHDVAKGGESGPPNYRDMIAAHAQNDHLVDRLLDNSRVYETPGLVEYIAHKTRSVSILSKIASRNYLYSGSANGGVPRALLKNPAPVPVDLLRPFLQRSYFSMQDLHNIVADSGIRLEVTEMIEEHIREL
jgi:hypothetical protein